MQRAGGILGMLASMCAVCICIVAFLATVEFYSEPVAVAARVRAEWGLVSAVACLTCSTLMLNAVNIYPSVFTLVVAIIGMVIGGPYVTLCMTVAVIGASMGILDLWHNNR